MSTLSGLPTPLPVGTAAVLDDSLTAKLGKIYEVGGKLYMLVKTGSAIAAAAGKGLALGFTSGVMNGVADYPAAAQSDFLVSIPPGQVGSTNSTGLVASDVFLAQIWGVHTALLAANTTMVSAASQCLQANTTGYWAPYTLSLPGNQSKITNTAGASAAGGPVTGFISTII